MQDDEVVLSRNLVLGAGWGGTMLSRGNGSKLLEFQRIKF